MRSRINIQININCLSDLEQELSPKEHSLSSKLRELKKEFPLSKGLF